MVNRAIVIAIAAVAVLGVGGAGYWLGQNPISGKDADDTADAPAAPPPVGHWKLEAQFEGPLKDTIVQRWRDPKANVACYIYLPIIVQHSEPLQNGMVHYAGNDIGSISCVRAKS